MMYVATCHCGAVRLSFPTLRLGEALRCDCSLCRRRAAVMVPVPEAELTVKAGETLRCYTFHTHTAQHFFCGTCGVYTHHRRRSDPSTFAVNAGTIEGLDVRETVWRWTDGVNHVGDRRPAEASSPAKPNSAVDDGAAGED